MGRRARRKQEENTSRGAASAKPAAPETPGHNWPGEGSRYLVPVGVGLIVLLTLIIYGTTLTGTRYREPSPGQLCPGVSGAAGFAEAAPRLVFSSCLRRALRPIQG